MSSKYTYGLSNRQQIPAYFMRQAHGVGDLIAFAAVEATVSGNNYEPTEVDAK